MKLKLAVIGDSLAQGFQDGAIGSDLPLWSFPAVMARSLGLTVGAGAGHDFRVPGIPGPGLPLDVWELLRRVWRKTGSHIGLLEWLTQAAPAVTGYMDEVEKYYERGTASPPAFAGIHHNLAAHGLKVFESLHLNAIHCDEFIDEAHRWPRDGFLGTPSAAKYRAAKMVLDPGGQQRRATQVSNLEALVAAEEPDALILWLGANDCLGTVVDLEVRDMASDADPQLSLSGRRAYNLTSGPQFEEDYEELVTEVARILQGKKTRVFVGTVPDVSIPPIAKGLGEVQNDLFPYYVRFFVSDEKRNGQKRTKPPRFHRYLTGAQVRVVQDRIKGFNASIRAIVGQQGPNWHVVEIAAVLDKLAVRRRRKRAEEPLREYYLGKGWSQHPLLSLDPIPSLLMFELERERRKQGGLTSLDGVHPTTIGYGIAAEVFLEAMQQNGLPQADPRRVDWGALQARDRLLSEPPQVWDDLLGLASGYLSFFGDLAFRSLGSRV